MPIYLPPLQKKQLANVTGALQVGISDSPGDSPRQLPLCLGQVVTPLLSLYMLTSMLGGESGHPKNSPSQF